MASPEANARREAARRRYLEAREAGTPNTDLTAPAVPVQPEPDVTEAATQLRRAADEAYSLEQPGIPAAARARDRVDEMVDAPEPIAARPTLHESAVRALTPQGLVPDRRPDSYVDMAKELVKAKGAGGLAKDVVTAAPEVGGAIGTAIGTKAAGLVNWGREQLGYEPLKVPEQGGIAERVEALTGLDVSHRRGLAEQAAEGSETTPKEAIGAPIENTALWLMRVIGSTSPALVIESAERVPVPNLSGVVGAAREQDVGLKDRVSSMAQEFFTLSDAATEFGGYDPGAHQRIRRTDELPGADWLQGVLERIETGSGFETVTQEFARKRLGETAGDVAWYLGLGADIATNWEGALLSGPQAAIRVQRAARQLNQATPIGVKLSEPALWSAIKGNEVSAMRELGDRITAGLQDGSIHPDTLPDRWRITAEQVALNQHDRTLRELMEGEGINTGPAPVDTPYDVATKELEAARAEYGKAEAPAPIATPPAAPGSTASAVTPPAVVAPPPTPLAAVGTVPVNRTRPPTVAQARAGAVSPGDLQAAQAKVQDAQTRLDAEKQAAWRPPEKKTAAHFAARGRVSQRERALAELLAQQPQDAAKITRARGQLQEAQAALGRFEDPEPPAAWLLAKQRGIELRTEELRKAKDELKALTPPRVPTHEEIAKVKEDLEAMEALAVKHADDADFLADLNRRMKDRKEKLGEMVDLAIADRERRAAEPKPPPAEPPPPAGVPGVDPGAWAQRQQRQTIVDERPKRPMLPQFTKNQHVQTAADFLRHATTIQRAPDRHPLGYDIPHSMGFERFDDAAERVIDRPLYNVRNARGDVVADGLTFPQAMERMVRRQMDGDMVWDDGTTRPVLTWGSRDEPRLSADYWFSSREEETLTRMARDNDPRAFPQRLRRLEEAKAAAKEERAAAKAAKAGTPTPTAAETVGGQLVKTLTGAPSMPAVPPTGRVADVMRETARLVSTELVGSDRLKPLPNGALVSPRDHAEILRRVNEAVGMRGPEALQVIQRGGELTAEQLARFRAIDPSMPDRLTVPAWRKLQDRALEQVGGALADTRYRVQGMLPLGRKLMTALADPHIDRFKVRRLPNRKVYEAPFEWFTEDVLARIPAQARNTWKGLETTLARNADELAEEVKQEIKVGGTSEEILRRVVGRVIGQRYPIVHPELLEQAERIASDRTALRNPAVLDELRRTWKGPRPEWLDSSEDLLAADGVWRWARDSRETAADIARDWIRSALAEGKLDVSGRSMLSQDIARIPVEELLPVYREVVHGGRTAGPAARPILQRLGMAKEPTTDAVVNFALTMRAKGKVTEAADELLGMGAVVRSNDIRRPVLAAALNDELKVWNDQLKRWEYRYTEAATTWALNRLRDWGIEPGARTTLDATTLGRQQVLVPRFLLDELESIQRSGALGSRNLSAYQLYNKGFRYFKEAVTHGVIAPQPAYFLGQLIGMLPTLVTTRGWGGMAATVSGPLFTHPSLVSELVKRVGGVGLPTSRPRTPGGNLLLTKDGRIHSADDLEEVIRKHGLNETRPAFETETGLRELLARQDVQTFLGRGVQMIAKPVRWWQETIRRFAGAVDINARIATLVDLVERGVPLEDAALQAKAAVLDFRALTAFERTYMRNAVTFYAFLRKNADAHVRSLLENPERVVSQMRLAHASMQQQGLSGLELGALSDADVGRLSFYNDEEVVDSKGRPNPLYRLNRITSTPVGVSEWLMQMRAMTAPLTGSEQGTKDALSMLSPAIATPVILAMHRKPDRGFDTPMANRVPPILMDLAPEFMMDQFGVGPELLEADDDPALADPDASAVFNGRPAVWVAGAPYTTPGVAAQQRKRAAWQAFQLWTGRPLNQAELAYERLGYEPLPPWMKESDATRDLLLGTSTRPVITEDLARKRFEQKKVRELRADTTTIRPPEGVGPR